MPELHIPEGINYECTACGKCCSGWTVPMTASDYTRIAAVDWGALLPKFKGRQLFRPLKAYERKGTPYVQAMKPAEDGFCPFLVDNLCFIHGQYGSDVKPSMCQLFPYCFNETPSGIYTTVSFVSMGVVHNSGRALSDQRQMLASKFALFQLLYPGHHPNWSKLQLAVGQPMTWDEYLKHEDKLITALRQRQIPIEQRLLKGSEYLMSQIESKTPRSSRPVTSLKLKKLDRHFLAQLHKMYFPARPLGKGECDFNLFRFFYQVLYQSTKITIPGHAYTIEELHGFPWPDSDPEIESLLYRYFYSRIFGKLYFGAGFGQLSLISGFHHLIILLALIKQQAKAQAISRGSSQVGMIDVVPAVRELEKRLGESKLGAYEAGFWELMLQSQERAKRIIASSCLPGRP